MKQYEKLRHPLEERRITCDLHFSHSIWGKRPAGLIVHEANNRLPFSWKPSIKIDWAKVTCSLYGNEFAAVSSCHHNNIWYIWYICLIFMVCILLKISAKKSCYVYWTTALIYGNRGLFMQSLITPKRKIFGHLYSSKQAWIQLWK